MNRIIFYNSNAGTDVFDSPDTAVISQKQITLAQQGFKVICVINYSLRSFAYKCDDFEEFSDEVDDLVFGCAHYVAPAN